MTQPDPCGASCEPAEDAAAVDAVTSGDDAAVSLFSGVGGMDLAFERAGFRVVATAEIDKHARTILGRHFPAAHSYDDVKAVTRAGLLRDVGVVPRLVFGGFPCQDVSVAGRGAGLAGARSGLYFEALRVAEECRAEWVVIENVPGLLSSNGGRDMGTVLGSLADCGYGVAYRVLDAQYFGVPQRRRRVFIVGHLGDDGGSPAQVLGLAEGSLGHPAPSRSQGSTPAGAAAHGSGSPGGATRDIASAVTSSIRFGADDNTAQGGHLVVTSVLGDIAHTLTSEGADASEDGTGRGTPVVTYRKSKRAQTNTDDETWVEDDKTNTINLFDTGDARTTELIVKPLAFMWQAGGNNSASGAYEYDMTPTLPKSQTIAVMVHENQRGEITTNPTAGALTTGGGKPGQGYPVVFQDTTVRRLTPLELERLQGFPDGWTEGQADSHRQRQMGNAVAVPCVEWIARRVAASAFAQVPGDGTVLDEHDQRVADVCGQVAVADLAGDDASGVPDLIGDADVA